MHYTSIVLLRVLLHVLLHVLPCMCSSRAVSYTHLTLPTIYSV